MNAMSFGNKPPLRDDLISVIGGGSAPNMSMFGGGTPAVDMNINANSQPVRLMQKFVNDRGWGSPIDTTGMYDWRGNSVTAGSALANANANADAEKWAALAALLSGRYLDPRYIGSNLGSSHNSTGAGGYGR